MSPINPKKSLESILEHPTKRDYMITLLNEVNCDIDTALKYPKELFYEEIPTLYKFGVLPTHLKNFNLDEINILNCIMFRIRYNHDMPYSEFLSLNYKFIATGTSSLILLKDDEVLKYSKDNLKEYTLLRRLNSPKNVISLNEPISEFESFLEDYQKKLKDLEIFVFPLLKNKFSSSTKDLINNFVFETTFLRDNRKKFVPMRDPSFSNMRPNYLPNHRNLIYNSVVEDIKKLPNLLQFFSFPSPLLKGKLKLLRHNRIALAEKHLPLKLDYISGNSLADVIREQNLSNNQILIYTNNILNGLIELDTAGIKYHRDLRPANIMIDNKQDKAIIIDLGIATTDENALPKDNRRYGGPNDLVSLGQIVYKMATGSHLFLDSESMERTIYADSIKDARDKIYEDNNSLEYYLEKVNTNVKNDKLCTLIKDCITANAGDIYKIKEKYFGEIL